MKMFFKIVNRYIANSTWKDLALIKFCLCAVGILIGMAIPDSARKIVAIVAVVVFTITYIILMKKFISSIMSMSDEDER